MPFITHPLEVARLLRDAGCTEAVVAAGLLHDVVEDAGVGMPELTARFGEDVATLIAAVTDDPRIESYRDRKRRLRDQVRRAGGDAALLFAADKIAQVREWPAQRARDRRRLDELAPDGAARRRLEERDRLRMEHYRETLRMLRDVVPGHALVTRLGDELGRLAAASAS